MGRPIKTRLRELLPSLAAQLSSVTGVDPELVLWAARGRVPHFQGDADLVLRLGPPAPDPGATEAAGRHSLLVARTLQVTPRVRVGLDQSDRDDIALLDADLGLMALEDLVVDAMHVWAVGSGSDWLTSIPMRWVGGAPPVHVTPESDSWLHSDLTFQIMYETRLTDTGY